MVASALADEVSWRARVGKLPYLRMFLHPEDSPRSTFCVLLWVPRFRLGSRSELGLTCVTCRCGTMPSNNKQRFPV